MSVIEKVSIKYVGTCDQRGVSQQYEITLPSHPTDYDGLAKEIKESDCYKLNRIYSNYHLRELRYFADGTSVTRSQVEEVLQIADRVMRGSADKSDPAGIPPASKEWVKAVYEVLSCVYASVHWRHDEKDTRKPSSEQEEMEADIVLNRIRSLAKKGESGH